MNNLRIKDLPSAEAERLLHFKKKEILMEFYNACMTGFPFILTVYKSPTGWCMKVCQFQLIKQGNNKMTSELIDVDFKKVENYKIGHIFKGRTLCLDQTLERKYRPLANSKYAAYFNSKLVSQIFTLKPMGTKDNKIIGIQYFQKSDWEDDLINPQNILQIQNEGNNLIKMETPYTIPDLKLPKTEYWDSL